jgi:hypothetical protein
MEPVTPYRGRTAPIRATARPAFRARSRAGRVTTASAGTSARRARPSEGASVQNATSFSHSPSWWA